MTCRRARRFARPPRAYGYTILIQPAQQFTTEGQDIEGIGWWPHAPRTHFRFFYGWYKYKSDAFQRAKELNQ